MTVFLFQPKIAMSILLLLILFSGCSIIQA